MDDLDEIVHEFLVESHENLDQLDRDLVALESTPGSRELLSSVFRTIHTIKGTSGFLAFNALERVTHAGENLLVELRDGRRRMDEPTTDVLLAMVDVVRAILGAVEATGGEGDVDVAPVVDRIAGVLARPAGATAPVEVLAPAPTEVLAVAPAGVPADAPAALALPEPPVPAPAAPALPEPPAPAPAGPVPPTSADVARTGDVPHPRPAGDAPAEPDGAVRSAAEGSVRVDVDLLDVLVRQVGELVLARNSISRLAEGTGDVDLVRAAQRLSLIASELQEGVMRTRMQPIEHVWSKVPRMVRDLAGACGRSVRLEMTGGDTELDRSLLEAVKDPLTHLVRNAVDHGIEAPVDRLAAGKPEAGVLTLRAYHAGGQVVVEVTDDGKGIDPHKVAATAVARGLRRQEEVAEATTAELLQLLFLPGFSTATTVTNVSGRGVGMDVVRTRIEAIGGTVDVESTLGVGTTWRLRIPLTLAIMPALTVGCGAETYAIPQVSLLELVSVDGGGAGVEHVGPAPVHRLRGDLLPLVDLRRVLEAPSRPADARAVIAVLQADTYRFGLLVDRVVNTEEIVVKALPPRLKAIGLYAGATLLGDGSVSLILDVQAIARRSVTGDVLEGAAAASVASAGTGATTTQVLVAGIGDGRRVAVPLASVTRLETLPTAALERVGGREVVQYRGSITPVVRLARLLGALGTPDGEELTVIVCAASGREVAVVVEEVVDIVDDVEAGHSDVGDHGISGSTVLKDRVTELVDIRALLVAAGAVPADHGPRPVDVLVEV